MKNDGGPAFPTPHQERDGDTYATIHESGMSLRDYFAAHAPAVPHDYETKHLICGWTHSQIAAHWANEYADAMLKERAK